MATRKHLIVSTIKLLEKREQLEIKIIQQIGKMKDELNKELRKEA